MCKLGELSKFLEYSSNKLEISSALTSDIIFVLERRDTIFFFFFYLCTRPHMHKRKFHIYNEKGQIECFIFFLGKVPIVIINSDIFEKLRPLRGFWKIPNWNWGFLFFNLFPVFLLFPEAIYLFSDASLSLYENICMEPTLSNNYVQSTCL